MRTKILTIAAIVLLIISCKQTENKQQVSETNAISSIKYEIKINGMTCTGCEQTIQSAVSALKGINNIKASHSKGNAIVEFDTTSTDTNAIKLAINKTGYTVLSFISQN